MKQTAALTLCLALAGAVHAQALSPSALEHSQVARYARGTQTGLRALERAFVLQQLDGFVANPVGGVAAPDTVTELVPDFGFVPNSSMGVQWSLIPGETANSAWLCARLTTDDAAALRGFLQGARGAGAHRVAAADCRSAALPMQALPVTVAVVKFVDLAGVGTSSPDLASETPDAIGEPAADEPATLQADSRRGWAQRPLRVGHVSDSRLEHLREIAGRSASRSAFARPRLPGQLR